LAVHSVRKLFVKCINNLALQCCYLGIWLVKSPVPIITVTVLVLTDLTCSNVRKVWPELKWPFEQRPEEVAMVVVHYTVVEFIHIFYTQLHIIHSNSDEDHTRALNAGINDPPKEWKWPRGHPHQTWLRTVENDLKGSNIRTWDCGRPSTELMTVIFGVISWKPRLSCSGMLLSDDDDETYTQMKDALSCLHNADWLQSPVL